MTDLATNFLPAFDLPDSLSPIEEIESEIQRVTETPAETPQDQEAKAELLKTLETILASAQEITGAVHAPTIGIAVGTAPGREPVCRPASAR